MLKFLTIILGLMGFGACSEAAEILKANKRSVLVQFEPMEENFVSGDRLIVLKDGKKQGLIEISKIKNNKFLARVLVGKVAPGMELQRFDVVTETKPTPNVSNRETVTIRIYSNYVWRGISYNHPYIAGSIDYVDSGFVGGLTVSNAEKPATSEVDLALGYNFNQINWSLTPMILHYAYPGSNGLNTTDFLLTYTYRVFFIEASYIPKYFGVNTDSRYARLGTLFSLSQRWKVSAHYGYSGFSNQSNLGFNDYREGKIGLQYATPEFTVEFAWSDTTRKVKDDTAAVMISKQF